MPRLTLCVILFASLANSAAAQTGDPSKQIQPPEFDGLKALKHPDANVRLSAVQLLCDLGPVAKFAIPSLHEQLKDEKTTIVRVKVAEALWKIEKPSARALLPTLENALADKDASARANAANVIGQIGPAAKSMAPALAKALQDKDLSVSIEAALALGEIGPAAKAAVPALLETLKREEVYLLEPFVVGTLAKIGEDAVPQLKEALTAKEFRLKRSAAYALGLIGPPAADAVEPLGKLLAAPEADLRAIAARALGKIGEAAKSTLPLLTKLLNDKEPWPHIEAAVALWHIAKDKAGLPLLGKAMLHQEIKVREQACRAFAELGPAKFEPLTELIGGLKDTAPNVRALAAEALGIIGKPQTEAVPALRLAFKDDNASVRANAALALWRIEPKAKDVIPTLIDWLSDKDAQIRKSAAAALGEIGSDARPAWETLLKLYRDDDIVQVQRAAGLALLKIDPKAAAKAGVR